MRKLWVIIFPVLLLSACQVSSPPTTTAATTPVVSSESYLRVDGSTSTLPLQVTIACRLLHVTCSWQEGDFFTTNWQIVPEPSSDVPQASIDAIYQLWHSGTHSAYENLIQDKVDLILVARKPSADELAEARRHRVNLEIVPVARDAFVFITHEENPVISLSLEQIRAIYTGALGKWSQVGGPDLPINPYQRDRNSGSQELMEELVMRGTAMIDAPDMILEGMMGPIHAILDDPNGIGYSVYYFATRIFPQPELKLLAIGGIQPEFETISNGTYPLTTEVYAVVRASLRFSHPARQVLEWLSSPDGQSAVVESGYVPLETGGS